MFLPRSRSLLVTCSAFALFACATVAGAQETAQPVAGDSTELKPIVLNGKTSRVSKEGTAADSPLASETTQETIAKRDIQSLDDLGNTVEPGVSFVSATKSVNIRGLEADRVLTTIDGIPIPFLTDPVRNASGGVDAYDFSAISTIDILRGGDSSRAGSGALGGAVILRTLEPEDVISEGKDWGAITKFTYDSSDRSFMGSAAAAKKIENTSILFQGSYKKGHETQSNGAVDGYGSLRTQADPLGYDKSNLLFKLRQQLEGGHTVGITAERYNYNSNKDLMDKQGATYLPNAYDQTSDLRRERVSLDYRYESLGDTFIDNAWGSVYWQRVLRTEGPRGIRLTAPVGDYYRLSDKTEKDIGAVGAMTGTYDTGALKHKITLGGDVSFFSTHQYINGDDSCDETVPTPTNCSFFHNNQSDEPDIDGTRLGIYLDDKISIGDSGFSLTPGVRFDWFDYKPSSTTQYENNSGYAGLPPGVSDTHFSPKLRAAWEIRPDVEIYAQWAMGFKAPSVSQLYSNYDNAPNYRQIGNPDLKPETVNGFEIGANLGDSDFGGGVKAFYNKYKDFIDSESTPDPAYSLGSIQYFNRERVKIWGFEGNMHRAFDNGIFARASLSYAYGEDMDTGEQITSVAPLKGIAAIGYEQENWGTELQVTGVKSVSSLSSVTFKAPGYGLFNLTGWYEPEQVKGLRLQAGIYNIFDRTYYDALETKDVSSITNTSNNRSFYSEPGRTFKISLTQRF